MIRSSYPPLGTPMPTATNVIPPITDPMGAHWRQPDTSNFVIDDTHALLTRQQFDGLLEYSTGVPSGVYIGKCWKSAIYERVGDNFRATGEWKLRWFGHDPDPKFCSNHQRIIIIID